MNCVRHANSTRHHPMEKTWWKPMKMCKKCNLHEPPCSKLTIDPKVNCISFASTRHGRVSASSLLGKVGLNTWEFETWQHIRGYASLWQDRALTLTLIFCGKKSNCNIHTQIVQIKAATKRCHQTLKSHGSNTCFKKINKNYMLRPRANNSSTWQCNFACGISTNALFSRFKTRHTQKFYLPKF